MSLAFIFDATTDGTERLRYVVTVDIAPLRAAKYHLADQAYGELMRTTFTPRAPSRG